jgi:DnaJ-domain-containing protein 1
MRVRRELQRLAGLQSHFESLRTALAFGLDEEALEKAYREIQAQVHPDRFAHAGDAERRRRCSGPRA